MIIAQVYCVINLSRIKKAAPQDVGGFLKIVVAYCQACTFLIMASAISAVPASPPRS